jgi:hypothetical protein
VLMAARRCWAELAIRCSWISPNSSDSRVHAIAGNLPTTARRIPAWLLDGGCRRTLAMA